MTLDYKLLGENIKKARNKCGISQFGLSDLTNLTPQYLSQVETGKKKASLLSLVKISTALNVSIDELLSDCRDNNRENLFLEISSIFFNTSTYEQKVLLETLKALKSILQHHNLDYNK